MSSNQPLPPPLLKTNYSMCHCVCVCFCCFMCVCVYVIMCLCQPSFFRERFVLFSSNIINAFFPLLFFFFFFLKRGQGNSRPLSLSLKTEQQMYIFISPGDDSDTENSATARSDIMELVELHMQSHTTSDSSSFKVNDSGSSWILKKSAGDCSLASKVSNLLQCSLFLSIRTMSSVLCRNSGFSWPSSVKTCGCAIRIVQLVEHQTCAGRLQVQAPAGVAGEVSSPELTFCADLFSVCIPTPG